MIFATLQEEQSLWNQGFQHVCGIDEVGRGCFAGPVVTAAVIFSSDVSLPAGITDSKLLTAKKRLELSEIIKQKALAWSICEGGIDHINEVGIGKATQHCFKKTVESLEIEPDFILIDAFFIQGLPKEKQKPIIHGDQLSISIAAASIIAKVYRDELMVELGAQFPGYGFEVNKGYGTKSHREAIKQIGLSPLHRKSFNLEKFTSNG